LHLYGENIDSNILEAFKVANSWIIGNSTVGDARKASTKMLAIAKELKNTTSIAVVRSVAHAVATAHMADHSIVAAFYALKAIKSKGLIIEDERNWQNKQLTPEISDLVVSARQLREII